MKFKIEIDCDNDAFGSRYTGCLDEVARIMRVLAHRLTMRGLEDGEAPLFDVNGNLVGNAWFDEDAAQAAPANTKGFPYVPR